MRALAVSIAAGLLLAVASAPPAAAQAPASASEAELEQARALVKLTNPPDVMLALNLAGWEAAIAKSLAIAPPVTKLEAEYPGLSKAAIDAARPLARRFCGEFVAAAMERKASIVAERLTPAEMAEAAAFYGTEAGQRVVRQFYANADMAKLATDLAMRRAQSEEATISAETLKRAEREAVRETAAQISAADQIVVMRYEQKPVARKLAAASAEADRQMLEMINNPNPEWLQKQAEVMSAAMLAFVDAQNAR